MLACCSHSGEALSALCSLAGSFTITTRTKDQAVATVIEFDKSGAIKSKTSIARPVGTTVTIAELFKVLYLAPSLYMLIGLACQQTLPVRFGEFRRNIKKQYAKLLRVIQVIWRLFRFHAGVTIWTLFKAYALITTGTKITCANSTTKKPQRNVVVATQVRFAVRGCVSRNTDNWSTGRVPRRAPQYYKCVWLFICSNAYAIRHHCWW